ncbi:hypothetical protein PROFUN_04979 [Planoprotostelium fungivorum]|uniref:Probable imidazolonepropionase n=1 Tax=Planoprotostelium fungivorum TaxID=1890364 RepID=A0A2P6NSQ7_9EUKA|nr:hypothetical protein PROFUN_04979 [Planoprotostelium fungivorum]
MLPGCRRYLQRPNANKYAGSLFKGDAEFRRKLLALQTSKIRNAAQVVTVSADGKSFKIKEQMNEIGLIENATVIVGSDGTIIDVGPEEVLSNKYKDFTFETDIDATGKSIIPGFVDGHTHPVWTGDRVHEFAMKLAGATYMDIHKMGGGIGFTVNHTRDASKEELKDLLHQRLNRMMKYGTTTVEAKSGYGLETETEMKMLEVLHEVNAVHPVDVVSTYLGAHSVPKGKTAAEATEDILNRQIPELMRRREEGKISPRNIDVFLEKGVFEGEDTKKILEAGKTAGLLLNFHGDEIHPMCSGQLGGELGAAAISHLERVDDEGIIAMAKKPTVAVLLPTTAYILRLEPPPARKLIEGNVPVALGSDYNPNAHCMSMPNVMNLACVLMKMTMNEALVAATLNSAASLELSHKYGSIETGKQGDFVIIDHSRWEHIIYEMVDPPIHSVVKGGKVVFSNRT